MKHLVLLLLATAGLALCGCSSVKSRIDERPGVFASLDPATQAKIRKGEVDLGYTPDMVYLALGEPSSRHQDLTPGGVKMTWVYHQYYQDYVGTNVAYVRRVVYYPPTRSYIVVVEPVPQDVYAPRAEDKVRVEFQNGKVSAIEQAKDK